MVADGNITFALRIKDLPGQATMTETPEASEEGERKLRTSKELAQLQVQGVLPYFNPAIYEMANPIVRSALFGLSKHKLYYQEWETTFSVGGGSLQQRGPSLNTDHEELWARLLTYARGTSLTKGIHVRIVDLIRDLNYSTGGPNFARVSRMLNDLEAASVRISHKPALKRLYELLTDKNLAKRADGKFLVELIRNRYSEHLKAIQAALASDSNEPVYVTLRFIERKTTHPISGREVISLDPMTCLFFDGTNTTLIPYKVREKLNPISKRLLTFIGSHRDGVYRMRLYFYFMLVGYKGDYTKLERKFKSEFIKTCTALQERNYIKPGWGIERNEDHEWMVFGLQIGDAARVKEAMEEYIATGRDGSAQPEADESDGEILDLIAETGELFDMDVPEAST